MCKPIQVVTVAIVAHLAAGALAAQEPQGTTADQSGKCVTWGPVQRTVWYDYRLINPTPKPATDVDVHVPLPRLSPRQEIHYLRLPGRKEHRVFTDEHGQRIVHYRFDRIEPGEHVDLGYVVGITLKNIQWNASEPSRTGESPVLTPEQRQRYLTAETNYSMDSEIMRSAAASLTEGATTDYEKLARIHDYVTDSIRYVRDNTWDPAAVVLERGTGSCSEYNYVLSGLCRLAGMPTRCVGGTSNGHQDLPATDTVYHRWTEVFLEGFGWFPADCSRDANPIRGKRSHFGRVYVDALVWCQQAGGVDDTLGWDYRAKAHIRGDDPGIRESHFTRWFVYHPEDELNAACSWFLDGGPREPEPDLLECALLHWRESSVENRLRMIRALAGAGRNACLRWVVTLPEADHLRETCIRGLCESTELADTLLEKGRDLYAFRNWFRSNESNLVSAGDGRFMLSEPKTARKTATTTASSPEIWINLVPDVVARLGDSLSGDKKAAVAVMPVIDQTLAGLGGMGASVLSAIKDGAAKDLKVRLVDEERFDRWMTEHGPGSGEYWILANGDLDILPPDLAPDVVVVPVCITSKEKEAILYHLELKVLDLQSLKHTSAIARAIRKGEERESGHGVLIGGGDTVLARWEHDLATRHGGAWPLAGVRDALASADAAICNLECCVSLRGEPVDKGERCPFYYRARPEMLNCLTRAGIDLVTAANNHGGDYGPQSVADTVTWCGKAGLVCMGVGENAAAAEAPRLVQVGPVRVGFAGMDTTKPCFVAEADRPGSNYAAEDDDLAAFAEKVAQLGQWADGRCDLLVLTIHWGKNWVRETQPIHRKMARIAFEHGVDVILGHSAHRLQGIEILNGKPVVYDMGNLLFDCELTPEGRRSALFRLHLSKAGVHKIEVLPVEALEGHTVLAQYEAAAETLAEMRVLCSALATELSVEEDIEGRPMGVVHIAGPKVTVRAEPDPKLACTSFPADTEPIQPVVDDNLLTGEIPEDARKLIPPAKIAPGVELMAYRVPATTDEGGILQLVTWWRVTGPVGSSVMPAFDLRPGNGETPRRGTPWYTRHDAGDWTVPLTRLKPGAIVADHYPARLAGLPAGPCDVYGVLIDAARPEGDCVLERQHLGKIEIVPRGQ